MKFPEIKFEDVPANVKRLAEKRGRLEALRAKSEISYKAYEEVRLAAEATKAALVAYAGVYKIVPPWSGGDKEPWDTALGNDPLLRFLEREATGAHLHYKSERMCGDGLFQDLHHESHEYAIAALPSLPADDATVLRMRFGCDDSIANAVYGTLDAHAILSYDQVGQQLGITPDQVLSIESDALRKLGRGDWIQPSAEVKRPEVIESAEMLYGDDYPF
jgi:hypothetical protein